MLYRYAAEAASRFPTRAAVHTQNETMDYATLDRRANQLGRWLVNEARVKKGDRVGLWMDKSPSTVAAMQGVLRAGAAYVPIDPMSPPARARTIGDNCAIQVLICPATKADAYATAATAPGAAAAAQCDAQDVTPPTVLASESMWALCDAQNDAPLCPDTGPDDLAYILYTSGSTGTPKGVCISQRNAMAFVDWVVEILQPKETDRFGNHAPFHFDLSVLDLYVAFAAGGCVCPVPEGIAYMAPRLVQWLAREEVTVWYSVPSALILMMEHGDLASQVPASLHTVFFAGEPFPMPQLRELRAMVPAARLFNLYGPTETNVCTYHAVVDADLAPECTSLPIGKACSGDKAWAVREDGGVAKEGEEGELLVSGPTVMLGYWGKPPQGRAPYPTGDIVRVLAGDAFAYVNRKDHMVKVRGYRVELGEIESQLVRHGDVKHAAVVVAGRGIGARLVAYVTATDSADEETTNAEAADEATARRNPTLLSVKKHLAGLVPRYMIVDQLEVLPDLPRTRNGKVDRRALQQRAESAQQDQPAANSNSTNQTNSTSEEVA